MNEGMNNSVSHYAPKGMNFSGTTSLKTRVYVAAGIQLVGHHYFWASALSLLGVDMTSQLELALIMRDKRKVKKFFYEHDHKNMAKRNKVYHDKFRNELVKQQTDAKRGAVYSSKSGCDATINTNTKNICAHLEHGCGGMSKHKTAVSKWCLYSKMKGMDLVAAKDSWTIAMKSLTEEQKDRVEFMFPTDTPGGKSHQKHFYHVSFLT